MNEPIESKPQRSRAAKWTRRGFMGAGVLAGGGLLIGVGVRPGNPVDRLGPIVAGGTGEQLVNSWVKIGTDNSVTAIVPHCEMGQGAHSVLAQMLADELDADWSLVRVMQAPADGNYVVPDSGRLFAVPFTIDSPDWLEPTWNGLFTGVAKLVDGLGTGGSASVRATGQHTMRIAGAAARAMLVAAAAKQWGVPASEIVTSKSTLSHPRTGRSAPYASLAAAAAAEDMPQVPPLKEPKDYKLMGTSAPRTDIPAKVNGSAVFGIDAVIDGQRMRYAAVRAVPVPGTSITAVRDQQAKAMPGVLQVLNLGDFLAVVAESYWQAQQALNTIEAEYSQPQSPIRTSAEQFARFAAALDQAGETGGDMLVKAGDVKAAQGAAAKSVSAEYRVPFLAHSPLEPMNATVWVREGKCDIWISTQVPLQARTAVAKATGLSNGDVTLHQAFIGGAFGRRLKVDDAIQAARIGLATGYPVKMIWSREEDTQKGMFRPADISRFKAGVDAEGRLWAYDQVFTQRRGPRGASHPAYYDIPNLRIRQAPADAHLALASWRSVDHSQQGFFIESFIDELAHAAGQDPVTFRLALLGRSPRHKAVLQKAASMAGWGQPLAAGRGRGVALVESFGTIVAEVAEVDVSGGQPRVVKVWCAADPGYAMNPDGFRNQMEGGIVYGLTAALYGEITLKDGAVEQRNFHDYKMLRIDECPDIVVEILDGDHRKLGGGGEPGLPPIAPAVTNAIFAASGKRIRELPIAERFA